MSKISSDLLLMRKEWYNAFFALNIEQLDYLEADWFFSTNGQKMIYKKHQLRKLSLLKKDDPQSLAFTKRVESDVEYKIFVGIATVTGKAKIINEIDDISNINFIESWIKIGNCWKLQFSTFESIDA
ncbi:DUF4440 domain-containing protein [Vibrio sonorensis]|uniref:DUF4440 domain-containing protein n=1 Tax=Vibrio sonorensis TaxID=1004316 RepID=UPI0008DA8E88|nr:DUF4440 domain-containing protein [Vibrio sonorensis]